MSKKQVAGTPVIRNKKASRKFEILEKVDCGIALWGTEVKSLRAGHASLDEAFARLRDDEVWLLNFNIPPYSHGNIQNHDPIRPRKLLLRRREINKLAPKITLKGQTLVPLRVYFNDRGLCKVTLALARGKSHADKRDDLRTRDQKREIDRAMRGR